MTSWESVLLSLGFSLIGLPIAWLVNRWADYLLVADRQLALEEAVIDSKEALDLSNDTFIRTTDPAHHAAAQEMWRRCEASRTGNSDMRLPPLRELPRSPASAAS